MAAKGGECSAVQSEFHSISSQDDKEEEKEPTFIEQPPDRLICLICRSVMQEPHIVTCCSRKMCRDCIQRVHFSSQPCPNCREPNFSIFLEKQLNSEILDLKVHCTHHNNGCEWVGELRDLKKHTNPVNGSCGFVKVKCPFGCPVAYPRKDTIDHESICTNLPPEKQVKRTMRITDQFKEELQAMLSHFQELYKSESARVKELTAQLEVLKESHKKEEQHQEKMKYQFEAEKKQLLEESKQQIALLTQEMKMKNEEHQQQMIQLQQEFKKKEKERSDAVNKHLAELKEKEKKMEEQHQKQLIDIKDKLSTELKELYHDEHKQRMEETKEQSKNIHQELKQHYDEEYQQQLKEAKRTLELEKRKQLEGVRTVLAAEKEKLITEYTEECKKATAVMQTNLPHQAQHNQAIYTHNTVDPIPEQVPPEGGSNEAAAATGSGSAGDSKTFTGLREDVLLLMPKVRQDSSKNIEFFPEEGKVVVLASSEEEQDQCITQLQNAYQEIIKNHQLKSGSLEIPPAFQIESIFGLLDEFDAKYSQCHFSCDEKARVVRIVSMSSRQFDQAKKVLGDRMAGEKFEEKIGKSKGENGGGGGKPGKGAMGFKVSTKTGSSEVLSISKGHKLTVKRSNIVEEDVDAIVNAANSRLEHAGGVAGALNKASNGELQKASDTYVRNYGQVLVGGVAVTSAGGKLKCKRVIHAVGPIASSQVTDLSCSQLIYQAITNSLIEAEKMKAVSVSFPPLSTGIYAVKNLLAAEDIFQAILKYHYTNNSILKDIRIVILDEDTYSVFAQHLLAIKSNPIHTETSFQSPGADTHSNVPQSNGSSSHGSHTPGPTAGSENSPHASSGAKSKTWSGTGSGATGTGNTAWTGQGVAGSTAWSGQGGARNTAWSGQGGARITAWSGQGGARNTAWSGQGGARNTAWSGQGGARNTAWSGQGGARNTAWSGQGGAGSTAWSGQGGAGNTAWSGQGGARNTAWSGQGGAGNTAWSGQGGAGNTAWTGQGGSTGKEYKWMTGHGASGTGIMHPQLPGDGHFNQANQSGGGENGQQQSSLPAALPQSQVVVDLTNKGVMRSSSREENFSTSIDSLPITSPAADKEKITIGDEGCPICRNDIATDPITTKCCNQVFCKSCLKEFLKHSPYCPTCKEPLGKVKGNQPAGGTMTHHITSPSLPGYEGAGTIHIFYDIPGGIQTKEHPNPGQPYHRTRRIAYLPNTPEGQEVLRLLKKAFDAQLIFTVGTSHTTGVSNSVVWNDIHHKTVTHGDPYGYPDPTYLTRVKEELKAKGIQ